MEEEINKKNSNIDFTNVMNDVDDFVEKDNIDILKDYYNKKARVLIEKGMLRRGYKNIRFAFFIHVLFYTGRRVSEILGNTESKYNPLGPYPGLREEDISFPQNKIRFGILKKDHVKRNKYINVKTGHFDDERYNEDIVKKRPVPKWVGYGSTFMESLEAYITWAKGKGMIGNIIDLNDKRLFPFGRRYAYKRLKYACDDLQLYLDSEKVRTVYKIGPNGRPLLDGNKHKIILERKKGGRAIHPHSLRHGFASFFVKKAVVPQDFVYLKNLLQHSDFKTTETYVHLFDGQQEKAHNRLFEEEDNDGDENSQLLNNRNDMEEGKDEYAKSNERA